VWISYVFIYLAIKNLPRSLSFSRQDRETPERLAVLSEMVLNHIQCGRFLAEVLDDDHRATAHLAGLALLVDLAQARPFAQFLVRVNADQRNLMLVAQGSDQLLIVGLIEGFGQNAENSLTPIK